MCCSHESGAADKRSPDIGQCQLPSRVIETEAERSKTTFSGTQLEILVQVGIGTMFGYKSNQ